MARLAAEPKNYQLPPGNILLAEKNGIIFASFFKLSGVQYFNTASDANTVGIWIVGGNEGKNAHQTVGKGVQSV